MKKINVNNRVYREALVEVAGILAEQNRMNEFFMDSGLVNEELAMSQRLFGAQFCNLIYEVGDTTRKEAAFGAEMLFETDRHLNKRTKKIKRKTRGFYSKNILERMKTKEKYKKSFTPTIISTVLLKTLETWGFVECKKDSMGVKTYVMNGYKDDFLFGKV